MFLLIWVAAAWLAATAGVTLAFFGAKRSRLLYSWLFGDKPMAEGRLLSLPAKAGDRSTRLAA